MLPYFRKVERDLDFDGPLHGKDGPVAISRVPVSAWPGFTRAVAAALEGMGYANIEDQNARFEDGWFPMALSNDRTRRVVDGDGLSRRAAPARARTSRSAPTRP